MIKSIVIRGIHWTTGQRVSECPNYRVSCLQSILNTCTVGVPSGLSTVIMN